MADVSSRPRSPSFLERAGERQMELWALAREQIVVHGLSQQRVAEAEPAVLPRHQDLLGHRLAERLVQGVGLDPGDLRDRHLVEGAAGRNRPRGRLGVVREALDPQHERVPQRLGRGSAAIEPGRQEFLRVERVALAARVEPVDELPARWFSEDVRERLGQLETVERRELDSPHLLQALELWEQRAQRMTAVDLVGPVAEQEHDSLASQAAGQEVHERPRRAVGPMQVLEGYDHDAILAQAVDQLEQPLEQPQLGRRVVAPRRCGLLVDPGQKRRELCAGAAPERVEYGVTAAH
jgi:hypothetical protein